MNRSTFGQTDLVVSDICLGTMMFGDRCDYTESERIVSAALDAGINFFDTAAMYCDGVTEEFLGKILRGRRDDVVLATKVHAGIDGASIRTSIENSLKRLKTDYVDLYLIHWPVQGMNIEEVMAALADVVNAGKARFVGSCNYPAWLVAHSNKVARERGWQNARLVNNQVPYNLVERGIEVEILPQAVTEGLALTTYRPLLAGLLTGKYQPGSQIPLDSRGESDPRLLRWFQKYEQGVASLIELAHEKNVTPSQLAIGWVRGSPGVSCPIVGCSSVRQLESNIGAMHVSLSQEDRARLAQAFNAEVWEESGGAFKDLRRNVSLVQS